MGIQHGALVRNSLFFIGFLFIVFKSLATEVSLKPKFLGCSEEHSLYTQPPLQPPDVNEQKNVLAPFHVLSYPLMGLKKVALYVFSNPLKALCIGLMGTASLGHVAADNKTLFAAREAFLSLEGFNASNFSLADVPWSLLENETFMGGEIMNMTHGFQPELASEPFFSARIAPLGDDSPMVPGHDTQVCIGRAIPYQDILTIKTLQYRALERLCNNERPILVPGLYTASRGMIFPEQCKDFTFYPSYTFTEFSGLQESIRVENERVCEHFGFPYQGVFCGKGNTTAVKPLNRCAHMFCALIGHEECPSRPWYSRIADQFGHQCLATSVCDPFFILPKDVPFMWSVIRLCKSLYCHPQTSP